MLHLKNGKTIFIKETSHWNLLIIAVLKSVVSSMFLIGQCWSSQIWIWPMRSVHFLRLVPNLVPCPATGSCFSKFVINLYFIIRVTNLEMLSLVLILPLALYVWRVNHKNNNYFRIAKSKSTITILHIYTINYYCCIFHYVSYMYSIFYEPYVFQAYSKPMYMLCPIKKTTNSQQTSCVACLFFHWMKKTESFSTQVCIAID